MRRRTLATCVVAVLIAALASAGRPVPAGAQQVSIVVDGQAVAFDQPPAVIGGRVLIPLRGVFERLGARVEWQPASRLVVARRGPTVVLLRPGVATAHVNGSPVALDVPAMIVGGRTLVPLRFVAQAMGARVEWEPVNRVVYVFSSPAAQPPPAVPTPQVFPTVPVLPTPAPTPPPPVVIPPVQPVQPLPSLVEGTVVRVDPHAAPPRLHVRSDGFLWVFHVTPATGVFLTEVATGRGGSAGLDQLRPGDHVRITVDQAGQATVIRAAYREIVGLLQGSTVRALYLTDGQMLRLADEAVFLLDGRAVPRDQLRQGMELVVRLNPQTGEVWEVRARLTVAPPLPPVVPAPRIDAVSHNARGPLGIGEALVVTMRGTPGGRAAFDIARMQLGVPMSEGPPGRYVGRYVIRGGDVANQVPVTVHLRLGGLEISRFVDLVTVDGLPPEFTRRVPEPNTTTPNARPAIIVGFRDRGPSGINPERVRLWINGREVRGAAVTVTSASLTPPEPLPAGRHRISAQIEDFAGNEATTNWSFVVEQPAGPPPVPTPAPTLTPITPGPPSRPTATPPPPITVTPVPPAQPTATPVPPSGPAPGKVEPPAIRAPKSGERVKTPLEIRGTAAPGHRVEVTVVVQALDPPGPVVVLDPVIAEVSRKGAWEVRIALPTPIPSTGRVVITAVAIGPTGARSEPARTTITW